MTQNKFNNFSCLALIPARSGSKRIKNKNIREFGKHPLMAYSIQAAVDSQVFKQVIVSTDSQEIAKIAKYYGAYVPFLRPFNYATDTSADIEWTKYTLEKLAAIGIVSDCFSILRPTSPFRLGKTIRRAWEQFLSNESIDSLRAVEKCGQHPAKMWTVMKNRMHPIITNPDRNGTSWYSMPYQSLPEVYVQNASLEIAWCKLPLEKSTISGEKIMPFFTKGYEGYDINDEKDWFYAEQLIKIRKAVLPRIKLKPYVYEFTR